MSPTFNVVMKSRRAYASYVDLLQAIESSDPQPSTDEVFNYLQRRSLKASDIQLTARKVARLMAAIGRYYKPQNILDFACGTGQLLFYCGFADRRWGVDINPQAIALATKLLPEFEFSVGNALEIDDVDRFDLIITDLPFGQRVQGQRPSRPLESLLLEKALGLLADEGALVVVAPINVLTAPIFQPFRQQVLSDYALDMIVTLPSGTLAYSSVPSCILVIRNGKPREELYLARFDQSITQIVSNFKNRRGGFHISLNRVVDRWDRHYYDPRFDMIEAELAGHAVEYLGDMADVFRGHIFKRNQRLEKGDYLILYFIHLSGIADGFHQTIENRN